MNTTRSLTVSGAAAAALLAACVTALHKPAGRGVASLDPSCDPHFFDRDHLVGLGLNGTAGSIADLIRSAPDCFKSNQVAVYDSGSLHCSTFKAPRIILYVNDDAQGNTVCSFNSGVRDDYLAFYQRDPRADCHEDTLECERFNPGTNRFEFYEVKDSSRSGGRGISVSEVNPSQCLGCHKGVTPYLGAPNPRPNLENYPAWPGFYGSMHDHLAATPAEKENYLTQYLAYKPRNPRYSALPDVIGPDGTYSSGHGNGNTKPAVNLHNRLEGQDEQRIAAELTAPDALRRIWPFRYALLGALACDDDTKTFGSDGQPIPPQRRFQIESFIPDALRSQASVRFAAVASKALQQHQQNLRKLVEIQRRAGAYSFDQFEDECRIDLANDPTQPPETYQVDDHDDFWNAARLAYVAANLGLPVDDWSMTVLPTLDFEAGDKNIRDLLPLIAPWLLDRTQDQDLTLSLDTHLGVPPDPAQCERLRAKSLAALSGLASWPSPGDAPQPGGPVHDGPPQRLSSCIGCHVLGHAPPIPFNDSNLLKQAFARPAGTDPGSTLFAEILSRIDSGSMPPNATLGDSEKLQLKRYFEALRNN